MTQDKDAVELDEYIDQYEYHHDEGSYTPSKQEKLIILDALIGWEELRQHQKDNGWLPIETAPHGARKIIVFGGQYTSPEMVIADGDWWRSKDCPELAKPTHWMPLPPPPQTAEE